MKSESLSTKVAFGSDHQASPDTSGTHDERGGVSYDIAEVSGAGAFLADSVVGPSSIKSKSSEHLEAVGRILSSGRRGQVAGLKVSGEGAVGIKVVSDSTVLAREAQRAGEDLLGSITHTSALGSLVDESGDSSPKGTSDDESATESDLRRAPAVVEYGRVFASGGGVAISAPGGISGGIHIYPRSSDAEAVVSLPMDEGSGLRGGSSVSGAASGGGGGGEDGEVERDMPPDPDDIVRDESESAQLFSGFSRKGDTLMFNMLKKDSIDVVDREHEVSLIDEAFRDASAVEASVVIALVGSRGIGKTILAEQFFWASGCKLKIWFDASHPSILKRQYLDLAVSSGWLTESESKTIKIEGLLRLVADNLDRNHHNDYLIIFDQLTASSDQSWIDTYIPKRGGNILLTSMNVEFLADIVNQVIAVKPITATEMGIALRVAAGQAYDADHIIDTFLQRFKDSPQAFRMALFFIKKNSTRLSAYLSSHGDSIRSARIEKAVSMNACLFGAYFLNYKSIEASGPAVLVTLRRIAIFSPFKVPTVILRLMLDPDDRSFSRHLLMLMEYGLLDSFENKTFLKVESSLQDMLRILHKPEENFADLVFAMRFLLKCYREDVLPVRKDSAYYKWFFLCFQSIYLRLSSEDNQRLLIGNPEDVKSSYASFLLHFALYLKRIGVTTIDYRRELLERSYAFQVANGILDRMTIITLEKLAAIYHSEHCKDLRKEEFYLRKYIGATDELAVAEPGKIGVVKSKLGLVLARKGDLISAQRLLIEAREIFAELGLEGYRVKTTDNLTSVARLLSERSSSSHRDAEPMP